MEKNNISLNSIMQTVNSIPLQQVLDVAQKVTTVMPFPPVSDVIIMLLKILIQVQNVLSHIDIAQVQNALSLIDIQGEDKNTPVSSDDLAKTIEKAFKDGKLSTKEKDDIRQKATSLGLDVDELMANLKDLETMTKQAIEDGILSPEEFQTLSEQAKKCEIDADSFMEITNKQLSKQISK